MATNPLRSIPSVNELLESPPLRGLVDRISRNVVVSTARKVLDEIRTEVQTAASEKTLPSVSDMAERIARRIVQNEVPPLRPVINATGILLHAELGPPPLAEEALVELAGIAGEYAGQDTGPRAGVQSRRASAAEALLRELTVAEEAMVVSSAAGAIMLTLAALADGREVLVARGQVVEVANSYRLPEMVAAGGVRLREVGTTNCTRLADYADAVGEQTAAILLVHASNFRLVGASAATTLEELVGLGHRHKLPVIHDIGSAALIEPAQFGFGTEPTAAECVKAGADVVLFRGDGLLGGPECGLIVGDTAVVEQIRRHSMAGAFCTGKLTLAALAATLRLHRDAKKAAHAIPLLRLLSTSPDNLKNRAERMAQQMAAASGIEQTEAIAETSPFSEQSLLSVQLPTWCVALKPAGMSVESLAAALRQGSPSVVGRPGQDRLLLDLRSVLPRQDIHLVDAVEAIGNRGK